MSELPKRITYTARGGATKTRRLNHAIYRSFVQWFETARHRFAIPVRIVQVRRDVITIALSGDMEPAAGYVLGPLSLHHVPHLIAGSAIAPALHRKEILCWITHGTRTAAHAPAGWYCTHCPSERRRFHPSREAVWIAHLFEPFLAHVNHRIAERHATPDTIPSSSEPTCLLHHLLIGPEPDTWTLEPAPQHIG